MVREAESTQSSYNSFSDIFTNFYELHFPKRTIKFNKKFHKIEPWFTKGLLVSRNNKFRLSSLSAKKPSLENTRNFHLFRNLYNRVLKAAKKKYFDDEFQKNTRNLKKTWELINFAINSVKSKQSISTLFVNGINVTDPCIIANELNKFFVSAPLTIVEKIPFAEPPEVKFHNPISFSMNDSPITETEIIEAVNLLLCQLRQF